MHSLEEHEAAAAAGNESALDSELSILRDVFRMLPAGVTVQDGNGDYLLVNEAATTLLELAAAATAPSQLSDRRDTCLELLSRGHSAVLEEAVASGQARQVFLTSHRPVRIGERDYLISSTTDITEQKLLEDHLFRSAYYDELTGQIGRASCRERVLRLV